MTKNYLLILLAVSELAFGQIYFKDSATEMGVGVSPGLTYLGNGISFFDFDDDGWDDITLTTETGESLRFFKNVSGSFVEQFYLSPPLTHETKQVNWVDFDNDGDKDLFVTSPSNANRLYENIGSMVFQDISASAGFPATTEYTFGASWGDYDNDGYLDVFLSNYDNVSLTVPNSLYKNIGDGTFTNVTATAGLSSASYLSFCSAFFDFNNDGYQDIFVANDRYTYPNFMYKNNGDGTFTDDPQALDDGIFLDAMSATIGDFNNDGYFDIYMTNTSAGNILLKNNGNETFTNIAVSSGTAFNAIGWGAVFLDAENDMDLDLYVSGMYYNTNLLPYAFYENNNDETFSEPAGSGFEIDEVTSFSNAIGDLNNDGKFDLVVSNYDNEEIFVWENETSTSNNWLKINLEGTISNRDGIGSVIEIGINGQKQFRYTLCGEGYLSQNSGSEIFGLGSNLMVDYVKVNWLSGIEDVYNNVAANQVLNIEEGSETLNVDDDFQVHVQYFPNPVKDNLIIRATQPIQSVSVFNLLGQEIKSERPNKSNLEIDMSALRSGTYILQLKASNGRKHIKFVKN